MQKTESEIKNKEPLDYKFFHLQKKSEYSELIKYINSGSEEKVKAFLEKTPLPDKEKLNHFLSMACHHPHIPIVRLFLNEGADIHYDSELPLQNAIITGNIKLVDYLISIGANLKLLPNDYDSYLIFCNGEMINHLINNGFDVNEKMLEYFTVEDNLDGFRALHKYIPNADLSNSWLACCEFMACHIAEYLIDLLPNDYNIDNSKLYNLIGDDNELSLFRKILNRLSEPNKVINTFFLRIALQNSSLEIIKIILELGIDPNSEIMTDSDDNLLKLPILEHALECCSQLNLDEAGNSEEETEIIKLLLKYDANVTDSCLSLAVTTNNSDIFHLIYQSRDWSRKELIEALYESISLNISEKIWQFLHREIESESELDQKSIDLITKKIWENKRYVRFQYFIDFYGKEILLEKVSFESIINKLFSSKIKKWFKLEYLLSFYHWDVVKSYIHLDQLDSESLEYLKNKSLIE